MIGPTISRRPRIGRRPGIGRRPFFVALLALALAAPGAALQAQEDFPEGSLWRARGDSRVYVIANERKRPIPNEAVRLAYGWVESEIREADPDILAGIPNVQIIKTADDLTVYDILSGKRRPIRSLEELVLRGFSLEEVVTVSRLELESYPIEILTETATSTPTTTRLAVSPTPTAEPPLLQKIAQARQILAAAPPLYSAERAAGKTPTLGRGSRGSEVQRLQEKLRALGYFPKSTAPNGNFGPATENALKAFQKARQIGASGAVNVQTRAALEKEGLVVSQVAAAKAWRDTVPQERQVLLAAWQEPSDNTQLVRALVSTARVKIGKSSRSITVVKSLTPGFTVRYRSGSGVNIQYEITAPAGYMVLGNRFPIFDAPSGKVGTWPPREEIYVPYSDALRTPEVVAAGRAYLDATVHKALEKLRAKNVPSVSGRGLVADLADPTELKAIALIEHIDHDEFYQSDSKHDVINKVFTVLGANRETAYRFSGSSKGALGLAQFIRGTYTIIRKQYPDAALIHDFPEGMANHVNAFQAMALYLDVAGATLEPYATQYISQDPQELAVVLAELRAGAYNGGAGRIRGSVKAFGPQWSNGQVASSVILRSNIAAIKKQLTDLAKQLKRADTRERQELRQQEKSLQQQLNAHQTRLATLSRYSIRAETVTYLQKFRSARDILRTL